MALTNRKLLPILLIILTIFLIWLSSCSEAKKLQKAENRVLADVESVKRVREKTNQLYPCSNDTVITEIHDSTTVTLTNTVRKTDTVVKNGIKYIFHTDTAFFEKTKTVYQTKVVTDNELTNRQKDTINSLRLREAAHNGTIGEVRDNLTKSNKNTNKWKLYFWLLFGTAILSHVVRTYIGGWFSSITSIFKKK